MHPINPGWLVFILYIPASAWMEIEVMVNTSSILCKMYHNNSHNAWVSAERGWKTLTITNISINISKPLILRFHLASLESKYIDAMSHVHLSSEHIVNCDRLFYKME